MHYPDISSYLEGEKKRISLLQESNIDSPLIIEALFLSPNKRGEADYSVTSEVPELEIDEYGILGDRHRCDSWFRPRLREWHIYPKWVDIRQERHILMGTPAMSEKISQEMNVAVSPELLGWNIVLKRPDGKKVYLDGLPLWTDFMVCSDDAGETYNKDNLVVNMRLVTYQMWCGVTGASIANAHDDRSQVMNFVQNSQLYRGAILAIDGPKWNHMLKVWQKVFVGIPEGYIH